MDPEQLETDLLAQIAAKLAADELFGSCLSSGQKCIHACRVLREECKPEVPYSIIGQVLGLNRGTVYDHWKKFKRQRISHPRGRPSILTAEQLTTLINFLMSSFQKNEPVTITEARRFVKDQFDIDIIPNTLHHVIARDGRVKSVPASPMEDTRMAVTMEQIQTYFQELDQALSGVPAHFVFNLDEMGHQSWADAKTKICYVPIELQATHISYPVSRKGKRITLIACIAADGSFMRPALVISRKTFDDELLLLGYTPEKVEIYDQQKAYIDRDIFTDWFKDTFLVEVAARRQKYNYHGPAFLIMDNCTAHSGEAFDEMCAEHMIKPIFIPPHSSNQLQMLDLSIFGVTKRHIARVNKLERVNIQTNHIHEILQGFYASATPANIVASFRNGGVSLFMDVETRAILCKITPDTARCLIHPIASLEQAVEVDEAEEGGMERDPNQNRFLERVMIGMGATQ
jgi:hypothetical protein